MHRQFTVMHREIELNQIDDMIIVIEPNRKISVGSHPYSESILFHHLIFPKKWRTL